MLMPKRVKHRKQMRGNIRGHATRGHTVSFGDFGLQVMEPGEITSRQIESARIAISQNMGGEGRYWIRIFPQVPRTSKPLEVRMGKGKGEPEYWCALVKPGAIVFEIGGVPEVVARAALNRAAHKLALRCRLANRRPQI
ncbi:MAG: 50S ribosomal protein L16 [Planctomycetota bacterium]